MTLPTKLIAISIAEVSGYSVRLDEPFRRASAWQLVKTAVPFAAVIGMWW